jgi:Family of unknown function (DUF6967)
MEETGDAEVADIGRTDAPWGKDLLVQTIQYRSGMRIARLRIREGRRFTVLDLDEATARWLTDALGKALSPG